MDPLTTRKVQNEEPGYAGSIGSATTLLAAAVGPRADDYSQAFFLSLSLSANDSAGNYAVTVIGARGHEPVTSLSLSPPGHKPHKRPFPNALSTQ